MFVFRNLIRTQTHQTRHMSTALYFILRGFPSLFFYLECPPLPPNIQKIQFKEMCQTPCQRCKRKRTKYLKVLSTLFQVTLNQQSDMKLGAYTGVFQGGGSTLIFTFQRWFSTSWRTLRSQIVRSRQGESQSHLTNFLYSFMPRHNLKIQGACLQLKIESFLQTNRFL